MISQSRNSEKEKELLSAALELFVAYGFHGTPTSKIALQAGVANGTLFHYFKTKDELVLALYVDIKQKMSTYLEEHVLPETTLAGKFRAIFTNSMQWALANKTSFQFLQQFQTSPYLSRISPEETLGQVKDHLMLIQLAVDEGFFKPKPPELILTMVMGHIFGLFQYLCSSDFTNDEQNKVIEQGFEMLMAMLK